LDIIVVWTAPLPDHNRRHIAGTHLSQTRETSAFRPIHTRNARAQDTEIDFAMQAMDEDSALMALGEQFEGMAGQIQKLQGVGSEAHLEEIEAALRRLEPIERAIMTTPARTALGLGVKARHAAHVVSEYWNAPIDQIDWNARAVRLLIEAVCETAGLPLPLRDDRDA
jgi:hypothetical protein